MLIPRAPNPILRQLGSSPSVSQKPSVPQLHPFNQTSSFLSDVRDIPAFIKRPPREDHGPTLTREDSPGSRWDFCSARRQREIWDRAPSQQLPPASCSPELPGFADHIQTASGSTLEPASLGSLSTGARSLGKGCWPSHGPPRRPVPMRRCPAQRPRGGDVPGSSPALSKAWTEVRSQNCLLHPEGCAFFFFWKHHFRQHRSLPGKSTPRT